MNHKSEMMGGWSYQDTIKAIPMIAIGISSISLILGLIVTNLHLAKYGIYSSQFLRTDYILIGGVLLSLIAITEITIRYFIKDIKEASKKWKKQQFGLAIGQIVFSMLIFIPILAILIFLHGGVLNSLTELWEPVFGVLGLWMFSVSFASLAATVISKIKSNLSTNFLEEELSELVIVGPLILLGLGMYANSTYPFISTAYGGGNRAPVVLLPTSHGLEICKKLALPIQDNQTIGPINVLIESEKELTVLIQNGFSEKKVALRLNRELFDAVQARTMNQ